jgi:hypothetical protein
MPFLECLWSAGGDVVREGKCGLSSDAAARSMDFLVSLGSNGLAAWDTLGNEARALEKFRRGEVAMTVTSSAAISPLGNAPFEVGVAPVSGETGPVSCWSNDVLVVFARKSGAGTTAIASLLDALTASPSMVEHMRRMGSVPVRVSVRKKVELGSGLAEAAGVARGTPLITSWNPVEIELNRYVNRALRWGTEQSTR